MGCVPGTCEVVAHEHKTIVGSARIEDYVSSDLPYMPAYLSYDKQFLGPSAWFTNRPKAGNLCIVAVVVVKGWGSDTREF